jgi:hypothetical protein
MSHGYKEERMLVGCVEVSCCAFSFEALYPDPDYARLVGEKLTIFPHKKA